MTGLFYFVYIVFLSCLLHRPHHVAASGDKNGTLELVQMLYRHGDRAPINLYPNDIHKDPNIWPNGLGQLTKKGKVMQYRLGKWLRARYDGLVSKKWKPEEVIVRSTDVDRTLMSAACNLAAFYRPDKVDERFEKDLPWLPTPIHTAPLDTDTLMSVDKSCPRVKEEVALEEKLPEVQAYVETNADLFPYLSQHSGDNISTILSVDFLYDTLHIESLYNLSLPAWAQKVWPRMKEMTAFSFQMSAMTPELKRLRAGPLIKEMSFNFRKRVYNNSSQARMYMYSGHDTTLAILMQGLGVYNGEPPPYATTFLLELHNNQGQRFVKMYLMNDSSLVIPPHPLTLPGCHTECPLDKWLTLAGKVVPDNWAAECRTQTGLMLGADTVAALCVALVLAVSLLLLVAYNLSWWWRARPFSYHAVPNNSP